MTTTPGAYRAIFKKAVTRLLTDPSLGEQERHDAEHYLRLLDDPDYKFGKETRHSGSGDNLFFRS